MPVSDEQSQETIELEEIVSALDDIPPEKRVSAALAAASELLEFAAFEMAVDYPAETVAELLRTSANVKNAAQNSSEGEAFENMTVHMHQRKL